MIRPAAVAGRFYPSDPLRLKKEVDEFTAAPAASAKTSALGCIVPHAGYVYSGRVAGSVYSSLNLPLRFILLGPRHYPQGERLAMLSEGTWETPLGEARTDTALAAELKNAFPLLREDAVAHAPEHSLEVQLPFLLRLVENFAFAPVLIGADRFDVLESLGQAIASVVRKQNAITRVKDRKAIDAILALDAHRLYDTVRRERISMCGYGPAVVMLTAARELGAKKASLVRYATSADVTGDYDDVVGYAGIIVQ
jgi:MEMO1 family protein